MSKYTNAIRTLAKMKALDADNAERLLNAHANEQDGGEGSGNFGHAGRPGKKGGSAPGKGGGSAPKSSNSGGGSSLKEYVSKLASQEPQKKKTAREKIQEAVEKWKGNRLDPEGPADPKTGKPMRLQGKTETGQQIWRGESGAYTKRSNGELVPRESRFQIPPMGRKEGETPELLKKAESPEGVGAGDVVEYMGKQIKLSPQSKKWMDKIVKEHEKANPSQKKVQEEPDDYYDGPDEEWENNYRAEMEKERGWEERAESQEREKKKSDLLKGVTGKIDPKDYPEIFANGIVPYDPRQKGVESVEVVRGYNGSRLLEIKYENGESERITPESMRELSSYLASDPETSVPPYTKRENKRDLGIERMKTADWCFEEKQKYPQNSEEYKGYELAEKILSSPFPGRPTKADSARMRKEMLSNVSSQLQPSAVERYKKDLKNEPQITSDICDIADALGTKMIGLDHRIKAVGDKVSKDKEGKPIIDPETGEPKLVCRTQQKIMQDIAEAEAKGKTLTYDQCVNDINDYVRYTMGCTTKNLKDNYEKTVKMLEKKGYSLVKVKNFYEVDPMKNPFRGLTCVFESGTGTKFELQFHTPQSFAAKEVQHPLYEIDRGDKGYKPSPEEHEQLQARMRAVATEDKVPRPKSIEKIQSFKRK